MFLYFHRRSLRRRSVRFLPYVLAFLFLLDVFQLLGAFHAFSKNLAAGTVQYVDELPKDIRDQKIFIAAQFWTSEEVLAEFWLQNFLHLVRTLGTQNIHVSIISSGSFDNTADAVRWLDGRLDEMGVEKTIVIDPATHDDVIKAGPLDDRGRTKNGWIVTGDANHTDEKELRRIPYLSDLRNQGLEPMFSIQRSSGRIFDKILYLNDVYFKPADILTLLATNDGHFDVACGIDFHYPPAFYDTFALRDSEGRGPIMSTFPYFRSAETRNAILNGLPAKVASCWNGVLAVDAAPYYSQIEQDTEESGDSVTTGLRFRGVPDTLALKHLEASECCLIHADLIASGQAHRGIFMNPAVRTGYTSRAYRLTHDNSTGGFVSAWQYVAGVYKNRLARWKKDGISSSAGQDMAEVYTRIKQWQDEGATLGEKRVEVGGYCTIMEMHILIWKGWKHVW